MENNRDLNEFAAQIREESTNSSEVEDILYHEAFTRHVISLLIEGNELEDGSYSHHKTRGVEVCGYDISSDGTLNLFTVISKPMLPPPTIGKTEVETALRRLHTFLQKAIGGPYYMELEESTSAFDMAEHIFESRHNISRVCLYLFTDGLTTLDKIPDTKLNQLHVSYHVWDMRRLYQATSSGKQQEPIHIDFIEQFGAALPCLEETDSGYDYAVYLTIIPGIILKSLYEIHGSRLLELNVRSYLQAKGKVNQGIRRTILDQPKRFLAYNNGISVTASHIELVRLSQGGLGIKSLDDLQIVNGGQTTASIFHTAFKDKANISQLRVQAKISVVEPENRLNLVSLISRYANSQNKVNEADFSANDPIHVKLETLSRSIWAPTMENAQRPTRWFYERARGQYQNELNRGTSSSQKQFKAAHPITQKFTRTDLAKFEMTWKQLPHIVSLGAQKCFIQFNTLLQKKGPFDVDRLYFQHLIAKAILFRKAEAIISQQKFGGYRANIVTYTLAFIYYHTNGRINLDMIWQRQTLGEGLCEAIEHGSHHVHAVIISPPGSKNITEWCKRPECWNTIHNLQIYLPTSLQNDLLSTESEENIIESKDSESPTSETQQLMAQIGTIPSIVWFQLTSWGRETRSLNADKRRFASSFGQARQKGNPLSIKDSKRAIVILKEARRLGFKAEASIQVSIDKITSSR